MDKNKLITHLNQRQEINSSHAPNNLRSNKQLRIIYKFKQKQDKRQDSLNLFQGKMSRQNNYLRPNYEASKSQNTLSTRQFGQGSSIFDVGSRKSPINSSFFGDNPSVNDFSTNIQMQNLSVKLLQNDEERQAKQIYQQQLLYPKLKEKIVPFKDICYIKISRLSEEAPFFWNYNSTNLDKNNCFEVLAKNQFGGILSRKKLYSKYHQELEQKINDISFMKGLRKVQIAHVLTVLSQAQNTYSNLKNAYYIQKMDDGEYHGSIANNNKVHGLGIYYYNDGSVYQGELEYRKKHHRGVLTYPDGSKYDGGWVKDQMSGQGTYTDPIQSVFTGFFSKGCKEGKGKVTYKNGEILEGNWINGKEEGRFVLTIGSNNLLLQFQNGNVTHINGVSIDKIPQDSSQYTLIHLEILPDQIVINEYLKKIRQNSPQRQQQQQKQQNSKEPKQRNKQFQQLDQYTPYQHQQQQYQTRQFDQQYSQQQQHYSFKKM